VSSLLVDSSRRKSHVFRSDEHVGGQLDVVAGPGQAYARETGDPLVECADGVVVPVVHSRVPPQEKLVDLGQRHRQIVGQLHVQHRIGRASDPGSRRPWLVNDRGRRSGGAAETDCQSSDLGLHLLDPPHETLDPRAVRRGRCSAG
jgi:hypothetical protein